VVRGDGGKPSAQRLVAGAGEEILTGTAAPLV